MYDKYDFEDATIPELFISFDHIGLDLENVTGPNDERVNGRLRFMNVTQVLIEGNKAENPKSISSSLSSDGGVLCLKKEKEKEKYMLIVIWYGYDPKVMETVSYEITAKSIDWTVTGKFEGYSNE